MLGVANDKDADRVYSSILTYFFLLGMCVVLALSILSQDVLRIASTPPFYDAYKVIPLIALSYLLYGAFNVLEVGVYLENKTKYLALIVGVAAVLNVALNYLLVRSYGMMGAAAATAVSFAVMPIALYFVSRKLRPIKYEFGRIAKILIAAVPVYVASMFIHSDSAWLEGALRALTLLAYPILLYVLCFYRPEELRTVWKLLSGACTHIKGTLARARPENWRHKP
jgi:O-antigen/teichoic acid export membrane protein